MATAQQTKAEKEAQEKAAREAKAAAEKAKADAKAKAEADKKAKREPVFVTVFWHESRILTYPGHSYTKVDASMGVTKTRGFDGKEYDPTAINRKRGYEGHGSVVQLRPGENVIPEALWEDMQNHDVVKQYIEDGKLELFDPTALKGKEPSATPGMADDLDAYSYKDVIRLVSETMDVEKLKRWLDNVDPKRDKAEQIKDAISNQMKKIAASS